MSSESASTESPQNAEQHLQNTEQLVYSGRQSMTFALFGVAALLAGLLFAFADAQASNSKWFWVVAGPLIGFYAVNRAQKKTQTAAVKESSHGAYLGVFVGAITGCLMISLAIREPWMVPASLLALSLIHI